MRATLLLALCCALSGCPAGDVCPSGYVASGGACIAFDGGVVDASDAATRADTGVDGNVDAHVACGGACSGATPHCLTSNETCVGCVASTDCTTGTAHVCDTAGDHTCVGCVAEGDCTPTAEHCDPTNRVCVACLDSSQCTVAAAALCVATSHTCGPCTTNADCAHVTGRGICEAGACVECTIRNEIPCAGHTCNPATGTCTTTAPSSVPDQGACVADSECRTPSRCVPVSFAGVRRSGGFCLPPSAAGCTGCGTMVTEPRESLSGQPAATYCSVPEDYVTFESHRDGVARTVCTENAGCGAPGLDDGRCVSGHCFPGCAATCECPSGFGYTCHTDHFCS